MKVLRVTQVFVLLGVLIVPTTLRVGRSEICSVLFTFVGRIRSVWEMMSLLDGNLRRLP